MIDEAARDARPSAGSEPDAPVEDVDGRHVDRIKLARVVLVVVAAVAVWFHLWEPLSAFSVIGLTAALVGGYPIFKEAFANVVERRMTMELSMTIALVAALAIGQTFTALVITAFVLAAEILEHLTVARQSTFASHCVGSALAIEQINLALRPGIILIGPLEMLGGRARRPRRSRTRRCELPATRGPAFVPYLLAAA